MGMLKMKSIRELSEKDLRDRVEQMRSELSKLQTENAKGTLRNCLLYTSPSPRDRTRSRMPSSA